MIIKPTVGRVVWYRPSPMEGQSDQPHAALITYVHADDLVNLIMFTHRGQPIPMQRIYLAQEGVENPFKGHFAQWMPFQIGQAKKHEPMIQQELKL